MAQQKKTSNEKLSVRIDPGIIKEARKIAKRDYGDESKISPVVEEALARYIAAETRGDELKAILSATEGALYDRIGRKIEKEVDSLIDRIGSLYAKVAYENTLTTLLMEDIYFKNRAGSKERYEELRGIAAKRLRTRLTDSGVKQETINQEVSDKAISQNENSKNEEQKKIQELEYQLARAQRQLENQKKHYQIVEQLREEIREKEREAIRYQTLLKEFAHFMTQKRRWTSNEQLVKEFFTQNNLEW